MITETHGTQAIIIDSIKHNYSCTGVTEVFKMNFYFCKLQRFATAQVTFSVHKKIGNYYEFLSTVSILNFAPIVTVCCCQFNIHILLCFLSIKINIIFKSFGHILECLIQNSVRNHFDFVQKHLCLIIRLFFLQDSEQFQQQTSSFHKFISPQVKISMQHLDIYYLQRHNTLW